MAADLSLAYWRDLIAAAPPPSRNDRIVLALASIEGAAAAVDDGDLSAAKMMVADALLHLRAMGARA